MCRGKGTRINSFGEKKKNTGGGIILPDFKTYYEGTEFKMCYCDRVNTQKYTHTACMTSQFLTKVQCNREE